MTNISPNAETKSHKGTMFGISLNDLLTLANVSYLVSLAITLALSITLWRVSIAVQQNSEVELGKYKSDAAILIAEANQEAAEARKEASQANQKTAELRLEAERLKKLIAWRRLDQAQEDILLRELRGQTFEVWVAYIGNNPESGDYWMDISRVFQAAGLKVKGYNGMETGVGVVISGDPSAEMSALIRAFQNAGLQFAVTGPGYRNNLPGLAVVIGVKPPP